MRPPTKIWTPGTAMVLPVSGLSFFAGPPISPMSAHCTWVGLGLGLGQGLGLGLGRGLDVRELHLAARVGAAGPVDAQRLGHLVRVGVRARVGVVVVWLCGGVVVWLCGGVVEFVASNTLDRLAGSAHIIIIIYMIIYNFLKI